MTSAQSEETVLSIRISGHVRDLLDRYTALIGDSASFLVEQLVEHNVKVLRAAITTVQTYPPDEREKLLEELNRLMSESNEQMVREFLELAR